MQIKRNRSPNGRVVTFVLGATIAPRNWRELESLRCFVLTLFTRMPLENDRQLKRRRFSAKSLRSCGDVGGTAEGDSRSRQLVLISRSLEDTHSFWCATRGRETIAPAARWTAGVCDASLIGEILYTAGAAGAQQVLDQLKTASIQTRPIPGHLAARTWPCAYRVCVCVCVRRVCRTWGRRRPLGGWCLCTWPARPRRRLPRARLDAASPESQPAAGPRPQTLVGTAGPRGCRGITPRTPAQGAGAPRLRFVPATCLARARQLRGAPRFRIFSRMPRCPRHVPSSRSRSPGNVLELRGVVLLFGPLRAPGNIGKVLRGYRSRRTPEAELLHSRNKILPSHLSRSNPYATPTLLFRFQLRDFRSFPSRFHSHAVRCCSETRTC